MALLCEEPLPSGDPCEKCPTCMSLLLSGSAFDFTEVDAATNSGKAEIQKITESIQYDTFSGRRRLYLFDEAHQLTGGALDAMLKPLEESFPGSDDKKLVCIFCTTEPERMRPTIFSRCAPAFIIQPISPLDLSKRLAMVCDNEGIKYDSEMLISLAEMTECHIRDALKAIEGISMLGDINRENVISYMHLDLSSTYLDILLALGTDQGVVTSLTQKALLKASPVTCYEKLTEIALLAYQAAMGAPGIPAYLDAERIKALGAKMGTGLLGVASRLASRTGRPTAAMLHCDLGVLHHGGGAVGASTVIMMPSPTPLAVPAGVPPVDLSAQSRVQNPVSPSGNPGTLSVSALVPSQRIGLAQMGPSKDGSPVVPDWAVNDGTLPGTREVSKPTGMTPEEFGSVLGRILKEELASGSEGYPDMGRH